MSKVLLTGGSGFIASHVLDVLLKRGHTVVTTVRSQAKADKIKANHPDAGPRLGFAIVEDIAQPDAFKEAVVSDPPFDYVIHTASPFHFNVQDLHKDLLDPAVKGTTDILRSVKAGAPSVKRVVVTSSFAAIVDSVRNPPNHTYSEVDWNGVTLEEAQKDPGTIGYRASKTFAERAAWDFVAKEKPNFDLATMNPPLVFGPIHANLQSLDSLNTSNQRVRNLVSGAWKEKLPATGLYLFVDVRDLAEAHVDAIEKPDAGGKRFFVVAGYFSNAMLADIIKRNFPGKVADGLPTDVADGELPPKDKIPGFDNSQAAKILGVKYTSLEDSITDTAKSILPLM